MIIPTGIIMPLFLVAFVLTCYQYYRVDPRRRVLNPRFGVMAIATIGAFTYPFVAYVYGKGAMLPELSQGFALTGVLCLILAFILLRRMPPAEHY